jgi:hypothetical protein
MHTSPVEAVLQKPKSEQDPDFVTERYIRSPSVVSRRIAGETLIVPVRGKVGDLASIYSFNATGTLLWESLASAQSFGDLVEIIEREYAVEHEHAENDVRQFLNDAINASLIEIRKQEFASDGFASEGLDSGEFVSGHAFRRVEDDATKETRL